MGVEVKGTDTVKFRVSSETRERLKALKRGGESYDTLLRKLIRGWELLPSQVRLGVAIDVLRELKEAEG